MASNTTSLTPEDVFTPGSYPQHTYVMRSDRDLEQELGDSLQVAGQITSLVGPSKSGKTVLVERVVGPSSIVSITGSRLRTSDDLWLEILATLGGPHTTTLGTASADGTNASIEAGGRMGIPFVASGSAKAAGGLMSQRSTSTSETRDHTGLVQVVERLRGTNMVVLLDDFHYVARDVQLTIARELKDAVHRGVKVCIAAVPHRSADVIRANPDLRGRVAAVDVGFWTASDLQAIAVAGFDLLNVRLDAAAIRTFAAEAAGSPQLMQAICLDACHYLNLRSRFPILQELMIADQALVSVLKRASGRANRSRLVAALRAGPKERGNARLSHPLRGGGDGDVYECVVRAIAKDPPVMSFSYADLKTRVDEVCLEAGPRGVAITACLDHMHRLVDEMEPDELVLEWDSELQVLSVADPYLLFHLRWADLD